METSSTINPMPEDAPEVFDAHAYLDTFRTTMLETGQVTKGPVKAEHRQELHRYMPDAQKVIQKQIGRMQKMAPPDTPKKVLALAKPYTEAFTRLSHDLGLAALRLADKGDDRFIAPLRDSTSRQLILSSLAMGFRSVAWHIEGKSVRNLKQTTFKPKTVLYRSPAAMGQLVEQFPQFTPSEFKRAFKNLSKDPEGFLRAAESKMAELHADPRYKDMPSAVRSAVFNYPQLPEEYLDRVAAAIKTVTENPRLKVFSRRILVKRVLASPHTAAKSLELARERYDVLCRDPRYAHISATHIAEVVLRPEDPRTILNNVLKKVDQLLCNPRYSEFSLGHLTKAALKEHTTPEKYLDDLIATIDTYQAEPLFAVLLTRRTIRAAVILHGKEARKALLRLVADSSEAVDSD